MVSKCEQKLWELNVAFHDSSIKKKTWNKYDLFESAAIEKTSTL